MAREKTSSAAAPTYRALVGFNYPLAEPIKTEGPDGAEVLIREGRVEAGASGFTLPEAVAKSALAQGSVALEEKE